MSKKPHRVGCQFTVLINKLFTFFFSTVHANKSLFEFELKKYYNFDTNFSFGPVTMSYTFGTCFEATSSGVRKTEGPGPAVKGPDVHFLLADGAFKSVCEENFNNNIT